MTLLPRRASRAPLRVIDTGLQGARWNVAMTAALTELRSEGLIPDTLRLYRYRRSVLLGRHQDARQVIDAGFCQRTQVEIARRITGGGAVYMDAGVLAWDHVGADTNAARVSRQVCGAVAAGLGRLGLAARFRAPNEIVVGERRVSGSSGYVDGQAALHQGTLMIDVDLDAMAAVLTPPGESPDVIRNGLEERLTTVSAALGRDPAPGEVGQALIAGFADGLGCEAVRDTVSPAELERSARLHDAEYGTDVFVHGESAGRAE